MDLDSTPTSTRSTDDTEFDTPTQSHVTMTLSRRRPPPLPETAGDDYKECMKNHAATIGGHAVDGCGEYMSAPSTLTCAACGCHRNFHRRREAATAAITPPFLDCRPPPQPERLASPPFQYVPPHMLLALTSAVAAEEHHQEPATPSVENLVGRKRFRTKFSQEQKEKMQSFSEKMGWKMQKSNQTAVEEFCHEIGVPKGVLKVWMHNNKHTFGKKEGVINGGKNDVVEEVCRKSDDNGSHFQNESVNHFHDSNNGFSSSP